MALQVKCRSYSGSAARTFPSLNFVVQKGLFDVFLPFCVFFVSEPVDSDDEEDVGQKKKIPEHAWLPVHHLTLALPSSKTALAVVCCCLVFFHSSGP